MATVIEQPLGARRAAVGFDYDAQPKEFLYGCPLCGDTQQPIPYTECDRFGYDVQSWLCPTCTFCYLNPRMTAAGYAEFYKKWYRKIVAEICGDDTSPAGMEAEQIRYASNVCSAIEGMALHPSRRTALDVGGSTGIFADQLRNSWGYECTVLDPAPEELAIAESKGHRVIPGFAEQLEPSQQFSLISCLQTIDHLLEPIAVLKKLREVLVPHGILVIDFVNYVVWARRYGRHKVIKIDHPNNFTAATAEMILARTGFEPLQRIALDKEGRHLLYTCRPVPPVHSAVPVRSYVERRLAEVAK